MNNKVAIGNVFLFALIILPIYFIHGMPNDSELKYDMTYQLTINPLETKEKVIVLKNRHNTILVVPDNDNDKISCKFLDSNNYILDNDTEVSRCYLLVDQKSTESVLVQIQNSQEHNISVELKHVVK